MKAFTRRRTRDATPDPPPHHCLVGETVCQVRVWSDEEWERLAPGDRPAVCERVPGLGWVGAVLARGPLF